MKHAIITGGSSGIGKAIAKILIKKEYQLNLIARDSEKLKQTQQVLESTRTDSAQRVNVYSVDVSNQQQITSIIQQIISEQGAPDLVITCAADVNPGYVEELPLDDFKWLMEVNYLGTVYTIRAALPYMLEKKKGHILMISSMAGLIGTFGYASYAPTKAALKSLAETLRIELKPRGINVSICYPPDTDTPQLAKENLTKPLETKLLNETGGLYSPDYVAESSIKGVEKNKFAVVPGFSNYFLYLLGNPILTLWFKYADWIVKKAQKIKSEQSAAKK